jgi:hypothetical protein
MDSHRLKAKKGAFYQICHSKYKNTAKIYESVIIEGNRIILPYTQHLELIYL